MFIRKLDISGYKLLESTGIKRITAEFIAPIIIIIGTNGSGKSSLLRALTTYSQNKSLFHKEGYVNLLIEHENTDVKLGVFFDEKYPYFFEHNENNLNESGNTGTHNHLVEQHFNYTPELDKLMRMEYRMSRIGKKERKEFLMYFNPYNLEMILDYEKKISGSLRGIKNNIKMLNQRKSVLENKLIDEEALRVLKELVDKVKKELEGYEKGKLILDKELDTLINKRNKLLEVNSNIKGKELEDYLQYYENIISYLHKVYNENRELFSKNNYREANSINNSLTEIEKELNSIQPNIQDKICKYEEYLTYHKLDLDKEITPRKERLIAIEEIVNNYNRLNIPILTKENIEHILVNLEELFDIVRNLIDVSRIFNLKSLDKIKNKLSYLNNVIYTYNRELIDLEDNQNKINNSLNLLRNEKYPDNCVLNNCFLRSNIDSRINSFTNQLEQIEKRIFNLKKKIEKYIKASNVFNKIIDESDYYKHELERMREIFTRYNWVYKFIVEDKDITELLNKNKFFLTNKLSLLRDNLEEEKIILNIKEERNTIIFELAKLENPNIPVKNLLSDIINNLEKDIKSLQNRYEELDNKIKELQLLENVTKDYNTRYNNLNKLKESYNLWYQYEVYNKHIDLMRYVENEFNSHIDKLKDILIKNASVLQEQEHLHLILDREVNPNLIELTNKEVEYSLIAKSLSTSDGIPKNYLVSYLNSIINNANIILNQTWNYELQIVPLDKEEDIDFTFKRIVNGEEANDISLCSDSQKDIIDIAWNLSMIMTLGYGKVYPIYFDETDKHFDEGHREKLITLINSQIKNDHIRQIFLVNHHAALSSGLVNSQTICLSTSNISVPEVYNESTTIYYK